MLLTELAAEGGGSFGFIPDYSMVATVFINWAATALATAALHKTVVITHADGTETKLPSVSVQYGQPRSLHYVSPNPVRSVSLETMTVDVRPISGNEFHSARIDILQGIQRCLESDGTVQVFREIYDRYSRSDLSAVQEILRDVYPVVGDTEGQVHMAPRYYHTWGKHYLRAYRKAHELEQCMNFKDFGLQLYGGTLFHSIQSEGEAAFASLPALEPTGTPVVPSASSAASAASAASAPSMRQMLYNAQGGCFHGKSLVRMADNTRRTIMSLGRGDLVWTPTGTAAVRALVVCGVQEPIRGMCSIGDLSITPWHPIQVDGAWTFPCNVVPVEEVEVYTVYNIVLYKGHILDVNDVLCVTLGHSLKGPVVEHPFFGTERVIEDLQKCKGWFMGHAVYTNLKARRNAVTNCIEGWYDSP
jgi:hypothetical protein